MSRTAGTASTAAHPSVNEGISLTISSTGFASSGAAGASGKRYYLVDARNKVEAAINSLPSPAEPDAAERFAEAERVLASSRRHLGDELHDQYSITLADMKPEYVD